MLTLEYWRDLRVLDSLSGSEQQCSLFTKLDAFCLSPKPFLVHISNFLAVSANGSALVHQLLTLFPTHSFLLFAFLPVSQSFLHWTASFPMTEVFLSSLPQSPLFFILLLSWPVCLSLDISALVQPVPGPWTFSSLPSSVFSWKFLRLFNYFINEPWTIMRQNHQMRHAFRLF